MKRSRYTRIVAVPNENRYLLFNGITSALISLDEDLFRNAEQVLDAVENGRSEPEDSQSQEVYRMLVDGRFIVPQHVDEVALLRVRYNISRLNNPLSLTILPTLACNLACKYCYEREQNEFMEQDTIDAVCGFVKSRAEQDRIRDLHVSWYGGEPLLAVSTIRELSEKFLNLSRQFDFRYTSAITTNGTLLTKDIAEELLCNNVATIQVTVDGPKHIHDSRRPFKSSGRSSFDAVMRNLEHVVGRMRVSVRINTDEGNVGSAIDLVKTFADKGWLGRDTDFYPYMAQVGRLTEACADTGTEFCSVDGFFDQSMDFCKSCADCGVPVDTHALYHFPVSMKYNCGAVGLNTIVINPSGAIHKCGLLVTEPEESLGNIRDPLDLTNPNLLKWLDFDPFEVDECRECDLMPVCLGGCPKRVLQGEDPASSDSCRYIKRNIDTILALHAAQDAVASA